MGCAPSKGNTIAVQPAATPRAQPQAPPVTPPIYANASRPKVKAGNPLDERRPLPAIPITSSSDQSGSSASLTARQPSLTTVPEHDEGSGLQRNRLEKIDVNAMVSDAKENLPNTDVKHTQSSVAFTFDFGDTNVKPAGRLPPLIREKTMRKSTEAEDLKSSILKKQMEAKDRRQTELNSIAGKKKRRKVKLKTKKTESEIPTEVSPQSQKTEAPPSPDFATHQVVPPLEISSQSSTQKNDSQSSEQNTIDDNLNQTFNVKTDQRVTAEVETEPQPVEPRKGSAYNDSTYGSGDETGVDMNARVVDPLRRFSRNKKSKKAVVHNDEDLDSSEENVNPIEAANFFDDDPNSQF